MSIPTPAPLRPQSAEQLLDELANQLQPTRLDIIHKMYRVAVRGHSPDDVLTVLKKLVDIAEAYARAAAPAAPLPCHTCGTILDPNWLNCPKCEGKARSTPVEKSALDTPTNEV